MDFLAKLAAVLVRPRATMERILAAPNARAVLLLFVLAAVSGIVGDLDAPKLQQVVTQSGGGRVAWIVACVVVAVIVGLTLLSWFYSWIPLLIGRFLGGTGEIGGVRAAFAWGLAPAIWALLYRVPAAIWFKSSADTAVRVQGGAVSFDPGRFANGCGVALVLAFVEFIVFLWCAFVMTNTLAEAHRISPLRAFGTIVLSAIAPLVVTLAAVLAMH